MCPSACHIQMSLAHYEKEQFRVISALHAFQIFSILWMFGSALILAPYASASNDSFARTS